MRFSLMIHNNMEIQYPTLGQLQQIEHYHRSAQSIQNSGQQTKSSLVRLQSNITQLSIPLIKDAIKTSATSHLKNIWEDSAP